MNNISIKITIYWLFLMAGLVFSAPQWGDTVSVKQPDGTRVQVTVWGDEYYHRVESLDGYTLARDKESKFICYGVLNADSTEFISTGEVYRGIQAAAPSPQKKSPNYLKRGKGLRIKKSARDKIIQKNRKKRNPEDSYLAPGSSSAPFVQDATPSHIPWNVTGDYFGITLLIDFPDEPGTISREEIDNYLNQEGYTGFGNNGSVRDYFYDVSGGTLNYTNYTTEYYTAAHNKSYYTDENASGRAKELVLEALEHLEDSGFDFSSLSLDGDYILAVNAFYAGYRDNAWSEGLWPHSGYMSGLFQADGVQTRRYQISDISDALSLATFCHENGHMLLDWPDLYDYGHDSRGIGRHGLMCNYGSRTNPLPPNAFFRSIVGWETVMLLTETENNLVFQTQSNSNQSYKYTNPYDRQEYFMIESRKKSGRNEALNDEGIMIWHVDRNEYGNSCQDMTPNCHYMVSLEQADGLFELENNNYSTTFPGDLFHADGINGFTPATLPNSNWWNGNNSGLYITEIGPVDNTMSFRFSTTGNSVTYHTITTTAGTGGNISPFGEVTVREGDDITFYFSPEEGYLNGLLLIDGQAMLYQDDYYHFFNVSSNHSIDISFSPVSEISGRVTNKGTPLQDITVTARGYAEIDTYTDDDGYYSLTVPDGTHSVIVDDYAYLEKTLEVRTPPDAQNVDFELIGKVEYSLSSIDEAVNKEESKKMTLVIENNLPEDYSFTLSVPMAYHSTISGEAGGPEYQWTDISATGQLLEDVSNSDEGGQFQSLSFDFPFYGSQYPEINVVSNGYLTFYEQDIMYQSSLLPNSNGVSLLIAGLLNDLDPGESGEIYFQDYGDKAIIQYENVKKYSDEIYVTFQIVLHKNGNINFYYKDVESLNHNFVVGLQNEAGDDGINVFYEDPENIHNEMAVAITPSSNWLSVSRTEGLVPANGNLSIDLTLNASGLNEGVYHKNYLLIKEYYDEEYSSKAAPSDVNASSVQSISFSSVGDYSKRGIPVKLTVTPEVDNCPDNPDKTQPGECGCGNPEGTCGPMQLYWEDFSSQGGNFSCTKSTCEWTSPDIDVAGDGTLSISAEGSCEVFSEFEDADYLKMSYSLDGGNWVVFFDHISSLESQTITAPVSGTGNSLKIKIEARTSAGNETYMIDDLIVTGEFIDQCPDDPEKTEPGECGCGVPEGTCNGSVTTIEAENCAMVNGDISPDAFASNETYVDLQSDGNLNCALSQSTGAYDLSFQIKVPSSSRSMGVYTGNTKLGVLSTSSTNWTILFINNVALGTNLEIRDSEGTAELDIDKIILTPTGVQNIPPVVEITEPVNNMHFDEHDNVAVDVEASDEDGSISKVELWDNGSLVETQTSFPYGFSVRDIEAGAHILTARAYDNEGAVSEDEVSITVYGDGQEKMIEAENCPITNGSVTASATASGGAYVDLQSDGSLSCYVGVDEGNYDFTFRIKVPNGTRSMGVWVNQTKVGTISTSSTTWVTETLTNVAMGTFIEIKDSEGTAELDIDNFEVKPSGNSNDLPYLETFDSMGGSFSCTKNTCEWISEPISIDGVSSLSYSADVSCHDIAEFEDTDYLRIYYSVNGTFWAPLLDHTGGIETKVDHNSITTGAASIQFKIEAMTSASNETYFVDNLTLVRK